MKKLTLTIVAFLGLFYGAMAQSTATHGVDITINSMAMIRATNAAAAAAPVLLRYFDLIGTAYLCLFTWHQNRTSRVSYKSLNKSHAHFMTIAP